MKSKSLLINTLNDVFTFRRISRNRLHWTLLALFCGFIYSHECQAQFDSSGFKAGNILLHETKLSGNFGELRSNHFHSGIDLKTNETEGLPVIAPFDGYVSRVKVSRSGYGKALYINHPGGVTTVYGHLRAFYPEINDTITALQQEKEVFDVEIFPDSNLYKVVAGQLIGFSGNTGSSQGPHVHFETRHTHSERPFNPELAGYQFTDTIPPVIKAVVIYTPAESAGLSFAQRQIIEIDTLNQTSAMTSLSPNQNFFIGFEGYDLSGAEENQLGIRAYNLKIGDSTVFSCRIDSFLFDETRFINSLIDYSFWMKNRRKFTLCHRLEGNELPFFGKEDGILTAAMIQSNPLFLEAEDFTGNKTIIELNITNTPPSSSIKVSKPAGDAVKYGVASSLKGSNYQLKIQNKSFYEDVILDVKSYPDTIGVQVANWVEILPDNLPVNEAIELMIKVEPEPSLPESKYLLVKADSIGNLEGYSGALKEGWFTGKIRSTGKFTVMADTVAPIMMDPYFTEDPYTGNLKLVLPFHPDLSGITEYKCHIDGYWVCGEFNAARNVIEIFFTSAVAEGHAFELGVKVEDRLGNIYTDNRKIFYGIRKQ